MMVEVEWTISGTTELHDVKDQQQAAEIVAELLRSFDLPDTTSHSTTYSEPQILRAFQFHYFPMRCPRCTLVVCYDQSSRQWFHVYSGTPACNGGATP
ncbi:hypothetical protein DSM43518_04802 [Mycobacterium marinum]|uniref:Uncharacterized protein n=1 Tax=Mycobacterium marinum TaxID=1781 RepID=A0A2Z5YJF9_MYCMR|nr:hypothetical protein [Mycobacterium marinum]AXN43441.1 hypothetical protein MM1218R_01493 [Mycobacterium marinum]AXN51260.1 hypothetical protein CCUG20998_03864 [Mycobacterium marinum]RFZ02815.1 hypothetical protein DSM43518_04802 [Mycobacterium marinum]RFZ11507.1 hypothetical protein DE4381_01095 [Mycobacterium marinum]RFZ26006.1 hypothetical protein DSM43519_01320 [Mycobacterium marinum]